jgi:hypothetical protein
MITDVFTVILCCCKLSIYQLLHIVARNIDWRLERVSRREDIVIMYVK